MRKDKNVLALGAGGFIGAHLTERLLADGYAVTAVDTHADKLRELLGHPRLRFHAEDIRNPEFDLHGLVQRADLVIDLIAYANPVLYVRMPVDVFRLNFIENLKIADACVLHEKRLIQFSSCEVYGKTVAAVLGERLSDPDNPAYATFSEDKSDCILGPVSRHRWIYACAKQLLERVLHAYGLEGDLNYTIIRPFNFLGPKIDYLPSALDAPPRVFSCFMEALFTGGPMQVVDGGRQRRCYTYIDDAVDCIARIVANPHGVCARQIFNIGSPENELTIRDMAERMRAIYAERFLPPGAPLSRIVDVTGEEFYGEGYEDSDRRIPDISKAQGLLGWTPQVGLDDLLERTIRYHVIEHLRKPASVAGAAS
jgi:UDP-apiose/xylose synthase